MALIKNEKGEFAWVTKPDETPIYHATKDEALAPATLPSAETRDGAGRCVTREKAEIVD